MARAIMSIQSPVIHSKVPAFRNLPINLKRTYRKLPIQNAHRKSRVFVRAQLGSRRDGAACHLTLARKEPNRAIHFAGSEALPPVALVCSEAASLA